MHSVIIGSVTLYLQILQALVQFSRILVLETRGRWGRANMPDQFYATMGELVDPIVLEAIAFYMRTCSNQVSGTILYRRLM